MEYIIIAIVIAALVIATRPLRKGLPGVAKFKRERDIIRRARLAKSKPKAMATRVNRDLPMMLRRQGF